MFEVLFYYYYLFDKKITDEDTHIWAMLHLAAVEGLTLSYIVSKILEKHYNLIAPAYIGLTIVGIIILCNYLYFIKSERYKKIIQAEPKFFSSHWLSVIFSLSTAVGTFCLYWFFP
jgi:hypothetical protein